MFWVIESSFPTRHPGDNQGANLKSISHGSYLFEVAIVWELTKETIVLPLGCLQGGCAARRRRRFYLTEYIYELVLESQLPHKVVNLLFNLAI